MKIQIGVVLFCLSLIGCKDAFEADISEEIPGLNTPADSAELQNFQVNFWWDGVEGASGYSLQIVTPSYDSLVALVLDSVVTVNQLKVTLPAGTYEWSIIAFNGAYDSQASFRKFTVIEPEDLSSLSIEGLSPLDNAIRTNEVTFSWSELTGADEYELKISDDQGVTEAYNTSTASYSLMLDDGAYNWSIIAENLTSKTIAVERVLTVDGTAPTLSLLSAIGDSILMPFTLDFNRPADDGTAVGDSIWIVTDTTQSAVTWYAFTEADTYELDQLEEGDYFLQFQSYDEAGNGSGLSDWTSFTVYVAENE